MRIPRPAESHESSIEPIENKSGTATSNCSSPLNKSLPLRQADHVGTKEDTITSMIKDEHDRDEPFPSLSDNI